MSTLVKSLATTAVLGATALLLLADQPPPEYCNHPEQEVTFDVTGTCGPAGTLRLQAPRDECAFTATEGAEAVGLPPRGWLNGTEDDDEQVDLLQGGWMLSGTVSRPASGNDGWQRPPAEDGGDSDAGLDEEWWYRECVATREQGVLKLSCTDQAGRDQPPSPGHCEAVLTPR